MIGMGDGGHCARGPVRMQVANMRMPQKKNNCIEE